MDIEEIDYIKPSGVFKFYKNGLISESLQYENEDKGKGEKFITKYKYDSLGLLTVKETKYGVKSIKDSTNWKSKSLITYHYSNKKIDSTVNILSWFFRNDQKLNYSTTTIYDKNGLKVFSVAMDSLITHYKHVK